MYLHLNFCVNSKSKSKNKHAHKNKPQGCHRSIPRSESMCHDKDKATMTVMTYANGNLGTGLEQPQKCSFYLQIVGIIKVTTLVMS